MFNPATLKTTLDRLTMHFREERAHFESPGYTETATRRDFIDPLFEALGWSMGLHAGERAADRDVIVEHGKTTGRPDYAFRLEGSTKFYVEVKAPGVSLAASGAPVQVKKYAWNHIGDPVYFAVATNFKELRLYECSRKPTSRRPDEGLIFAYTFEEFTNARTLANLWKLSRDSVRDRKLDKLLKSADRKRLPLDQQFLNDLSHWRLELARSAFRANPDLTPSDLNAAVQTVLDRLVFLRVGEDRGALPPGRLAALVRRWREDGGDLLRSLKKLFDEVNADLNGEIFKRDLSEPIEWDAEVIAGIVEEDLEPYDFARIGVEVLGSIYERYLGKTIRVTPQRVFLDDKPEVRKAGGVYYTPKYIVDYLVENTVGAVVKGLKPAELAKVRVVDPACGSGSFLIAAYDRLLSEHLDYYERSAHGRSVQQSELFTNGETGERQLSIREKARILKNSIFGVDIDPQAVEVTMMSLYIKMLENERGLPVKRALLPTLAENIKAGNSLLPTSDVPATATPDEKVSENAFDWWSAFPQVQREGGFDVVIGNPPYVRIEEDLHPNWALQFYRTYPVSQYRSDLFHLFLQKGIDVLAKSGKLGFIVPNPWLTLPNTEKLRRYILEHAKVDEVVVFDHLVFQDANVFTALVFFERTDRIPTQHSVRVKNCDDATTTEAIRDTPTDRVPQREWAAEEGAKFETRLVGAPGKLVKKIRGNSVRLDSVARASLGCQAYNASKHSQEQIANRVFHSERKEGKEWLPELAGNDVGRFTLERRRGQWIKYGPWLHDYREMDWLTGPRLLIREIVGRLPYRIQAAFTDATYCNYKTVLNVNPLPDASDKLESMKFLCGLLNSRLMSFVYPLTSNKMVAKGFPRLAVADVAALPVQTVNAADRDRVRIRAEIVRLVDRALDAQAQMRSATADQRRVLQREIEGTDRDLDRAVYALYGLTEREVRLVEELTMAPEAPRVAAG
jgi:type I restriction-modification system DNA methylase subunit